MAASAGSIPAITAAAASQLASHHGQHRERHGYDGGDAELARRSASRACRTRSRPGHRSPGPSPASVKALPSACCGPADAGGEPSARMIAKSRRRRRIEVISRCAMVSRATAASPVPSTCGKSCTWPKSSRSVGGGRAIYRERADLGQPRGEVLAACLRLDARPEPDEQRGGRRDGGFRGNQVSQASGSQRGAGAQAERIRLQGGEHAGPDDGHRAAPGCPGPGSKPGWWRRFGREGGAGSACRARSPRRFWAAARSLDAPGRTTRRRASRARSPRTRCARPATVARPREVAHVRHSPVMPDRGHHRAGAGPGIVSHGSVPDARRTGQARRAGG